MEGELTAAQQAALNLTQNFLANLCSNGVPIEYAIYEAYKFCDTTLRGETEICARMDEAANIVGRAVLAVGVHPKQQEATIGNE